MRKFKDPWRSFRARSGASVRQQKTTDQLNPAKAVRKENARPLLANRASALSAANFEASVFQTFPRCHPRLRDKNVPRGAGCSWFAPSLTQREETSGGNSITQVEMELASAPAPIDGDRQQRIQFRGQPTQGGTARLSRGTCRHSAVCRRTSSTGPRREYARPVDKGGGKKRAAPGPAASSSRCEWRKASKVPPQHIPSRISPPICDLQLGKASGFPATNWRDTRPTIGYNPDSGDKAHRPGSGQLSLPQGRRDLIGAGLPVGVQARGLLLPSP